MDLFSVNAEKRVPAGKGPIRRLKREGFIPGILYSEGDSIPISLEAVELKNILNKHGNDVYLNLNIEGKPMKVKVQEVQRDPVNLDDINHVDLMPADNTIH